MKLLKWFIVSYVCVVFTVIGCYEQISATTLSKEEVPYEVTAIKETKKGFQISGWGFLSETQHFLNESTHAYRLLLYHNGKQYRSYSLKLRNINQTELMRMEGIRMCQTNELNQKANICNYHFQQVGFTGMIPYDDLEMNQDYEVRLEVHAKQSQVTKEIPLYFPIPERISHRNDQYVYQAVSDLHATSIKVTYTDVFARSKPTANKEYYRTNNICSYTHGNALYFEKDSVFQTIYERKVVNDTTYYRVKGKEADCVSNFRRVQEGNVIDPLWIASAFVDYGGKPLTIQTYIDNTPPVITFDYEPVLHTDEVLKFDFQSIVHASDKEEGKLDHKIKQMKGNVQPIPGHYALTYYVEDKFKASDTKIMNVTIIEAKNKPPTITAKNHVIYQYEPFDYLKDVSAKDKEDGNLISKINYNGIVDSNKLGIYEITYMVTDSKGLTATKTITVEVIANPKENLRYISRSLPWYQEAIPLNWKDITSFLYDQFLFRPIYYESSF